MRCSRHILTLSLLALGAASQAVVLAVSGNGNGANGYASGSIGGQTGGVGLLSDWTLDETSQFGSVTGGNGGFIFSYTLGSSSTAGGSKSWSGTWTLVSGDGNYAGYTGTGTFSATILYLNVPDLSGPQSFGLAGELQAVPEPASMAALGLGAVALLKRRRKA
ncbi:PEP-CTERM sorting domain-containing protein [bacterium]|nr:MAG: PEP-CTERM sorting domain-containing protein [bacterium]